jgi:hypothetical protein
MSSSPTRVLAIDPIPKGITFAVVEGDYLLLDWGFRIRQGETKRLLERVEDLISRYEPDYLVVEDFEGDGSHRRPSAEKMIRALQRLAKRRGLRCRVFSREEIRQAFPADMRTRSRIAECLIERHPELGDTLPPPRKWYESGEDERMSIFDAVSLVNAFLVERKRRSA